MSVVNLSKKFASFNDVWVPRVVAQLNGQLVKVVKLHGEYIWHRHVHEDEMFWVISGELKIELRTQTVTLNPGEFFVVERGVEHRPVATQLVECVLFEPASVRTTGDADDHPYTIESSALDSI
ncbi:MAG: cupin domain-containing protein [Nannocystaceae bacterium]